MTPNPDTLSGEGDKPMWFAPIEKERGGSLILTRSGIYLDAEAAFALEQAYREISDVEWTGPNRPPFIDPQRELRAQLSELRSAIVSVGFRPNQHEARR